MTPASLVLEFGAGVDSDALVVTEFDPVRNVDSSGETKTSFIVNEDTKINFLIHLQAGLQIEWVRPTHGTIQVLCNDRQLREERCSFSFAEDARYADLKYFPAVQPEIFFYGNTPTLLPIRGRRLSVDGENGLPGKADVSYKVDFHSFCFHAPTGLEIRAGKTDYPIEIRIKVGVAP